MAANNQLKIIKKGVDIWNRWRKKNPDVDVNLSGESLQGLDLKRINLEKANLNDAKLSGANLSCANLKRATLKRADLTNTVLKGTDLKESNLRNANLEGALLNGSYLRRANLKGANLTGATLRCSSFVETKIGGANLMGCKIFGLSAWGLKGKPADQTSLVITPEGEPEITVDDLQVAQFIYLILNNKKVRNVIDTMTSKAVLILGRFTDDRKAVLDTIHNELRKRNYIPILFDFQGPKNRNITETITTLAHMARFIIADITDAKSIPQELQAIVPNLPSVPIQPLLFALQEEYSMFEHFRRYPWVLPIFQYKDVEEVVLSIGEKVMEPLEMKFQQLNN